MVFDRTFDRVAVYCGSSAGRRPEYAQAARDLGNEMVKHKIKLVYGGRTPAKAFTYLLHFFIEFAARYLNSNMSRYQDTFAFDPGPDIKQFPFSQAGM